MPDLTAEQAYARAAGLARCPKCGGSGDQNWADPEGPLIQCNCDTPHVAGYLPALVEGLTETCPCRLPVAAPCRPCLCGNPEMPWLKECENCHGAGHVPAPEEERAHRLLEGLAQGGWTYVLDKVPNKAHAATVSHRGTGKHATAFDTTAWGALARALVRAEGEGS